MRIKLGREYVVTESVAGRLVSASELINNIPTLTKRTMPGTKLMVVRRLDNFVQCLVDNDRFVVFDAAEFGHKIIINDKS